MFSSFIKNNFSNTKPKKRSLPKKLLAGISLMLFSLFSAMPAWADAVAGEVKKQPVNMSAIVMFFIFVLATLGITYWASKKNKSTTDFYTAGGGVSGFQNGLSIAGGCMSAA